MENKNKVINILKENLEGVTIQELSDTLNLTRSTISIVLARLDGEGKLRIRDVGRAKLHYLKEDKDGKKKLD